MADEGFTIPLEGDADPFKQALTEVRGTMRRVMRQMSQQTRGGRGEMTRLGRAWRAMGTAARVAGQLAQRGLRGIVRSARLAAQAVRGIFARIGGGLKALLPGRLAGLLSVAGVVGAVGAGAAGLKKAFDVGGELSDLAARTGIAVRDLVLLQQAFEDNGASAEQVGPVINKMQRAISDARAGLSTQVRAFERMNLAVEDLVGMTPAEQFEAIQQAIAGMPRQLDKAATAMEVFGRSGGELLTMFDDAGALGKARETIGRQADILQQNAARFDRISDLLKSAGKKLQGFFVGAAERIAPALQAVLEQLNRIDLSAMGARLGEGLLTIAAAIQSGRHMELLKAGLRLAMASGVDVLMRGVRATVAFVATALPPVIDAAFQKIRSPEFLKGFALLFRGAGEAIAAPIQKALGRNRAATGSRGRAEDFFAAAGMQFRFGGGDVDVHKVISDALVDGAMAGAKAAAGGPGRAVKDAVEELQRIHHELRAQRAKLREATPAGKPATAVPGVGLLLDEEEGGGRTASFARVVSAMQRIGGGGLGFTAVEPLVTETRRQTTVLRKIEQNTRGGVAGTGLGGAVYA